MNMTANTTTVLSLYDAVKRADGEAVAALLHPDVELHVPGHQPLSGVHSGIERVLAFLAATAAFVDAREEIEVLDVLESAERVALLCHVTGRRAGAVVLDNLTVHLLRIRDGRVAEIRFHNYDQDGVDAYWAAAA